ncbi:hypothetical protein [Aliivibrio fischeri]|uniref:hypothetical protein n=1 Tax=Aliivibrio fischeri TaxID=668 RepID=UPI0012D8D5DC|nr:hypothetical protein [Aliivibrio fischeri]MUJ21706.1 hypothetical protein [Aliivibrio fischeri]
MSNKSFSTREWIFTTVILSLVQGVVWYVSFVNSSNGSALTYVSFAGTLISIILAVLAIGYTYGESQGQKNKSDNVSIQIAVLNEVVKSIKFESQSLEHISTISDELTRFSSQFEAEMLNTKKSVEHVSISMDSLLAEYDKFPSNNKVIIPTNLDKKLLVNAFMARRTPLMEISMLFLYVADGKTYKKSSRAAEENAVKYITRAREELEEGDVNYNHNTSVDELFIGSTLSLITILNGLDLLTTDDDNRLIFSEELKNYIESNVIPSPKKTGPFYRMILNEVLKDIQ